MQYVSDTGYSVSSWNVDFSKRGRGRKVIKVDLIFLLVTKFRSVNNTFRPHDCIRLVVCLIIFFVF
jgi:hypothetical protein